MRRANGLLTAAVGAAALLAGCSAGATGPSAAVSGPSGTATQASGVVTGILAWVGGPLPAPPAPTPSPTPMSGTITLRGSGGQIFTTAAGNDGEFSISVPAGSYTVTGASVPGSPVPCETGSVTVLAGRSVTVLVLCPVP